MDYQDDADIYEHGIISAHPLAGLRLLATTRYPIYSGYSLAIVDVDDSSLTDRAIHVGQVPVAHAVRGLLRRIRLAVLPSRFALSLEPNNRLIRFDVSAVGKCPRPATHEERR